MKILEKILIVIVTGAVILFAVYKPPVKEETETLVDSSEQATDTNVSEAASPDETAEVRETATVATETVSDGRTSVEDQWHYRGYICDCNDVILVFNEGIMRIIADGCNVSLANVLDSYNSSLSVDRSFEKELRRANPTAVRSDDGHLIGQSVVLTLDSGLHNEIYAYMEANRIIGSVSVLSGDGAIRALVSYPSYDANADFSTLTLEPHACLNRCVEPAVPGSIFKLLSAVTADHYGIHSYDDPGYLADFGINNWDCNGAAYAVPVRRSLQSAIRNSSNCWFANVFYSVGASDVRGTLDRFFCYSTPLQCDLCTLSNTIKLDSAGDLARAGFGQREGVSPLYMGMVACGTVTGEVNKPYIGDHMLDTVTWKDLGSLSGKETISEIPAEYTDELKLGMLDVTSDLGLGFGEDRLLYTKTGTAESSSNDSDIHYILSVITDEGHSVDNTTAVVFQYMNSKAAYASGDSQHMQAILNIVKAHRP